MKQKFANVNVGAGAGAELQKGEAAGAGANAAAGAKLTKLVASALMMALLCVGLTSCNYLDQKKAQRAEVRGDVIIYDNTEYTNTGLAAPSSLSDLRNNPVLVVEEEVPLLLTGMYGIYIDMTWDEKLISYHGKLYASPAMTAAEIDALKNVTFDHFRLPKWYGDEDFWLSDEATRVLASALSGEGQDYDVVFEGGENAECVGTAWVYRCDEKGYFTQGTIDVQWYENGRVLLCDEAYLWYEVPQKDCAFVVALFDNEFKPVMTEVVPEV